MKVEGTESIEKIPKEIVDSANEVGEINSHEWRVMECQINVNISFKEFISVDDFLATYRSFTEAKIVDSVRSISEDDAAEENTDVPKVTTREAKNTVEILTTFLESQEIVGHRGFTALANEATRNK